MVESAPTKVFRPVQGVVAEVNGLLANFGTEFMKLCGEFSFSAEFRVLSFRREHFPGEEFLDGVL